MQTSKPAVQHNTKHINVCYSPNAKRKDKRIANRRYRHALNSTTRKLQKDSERFWNEGFNTPTFSDWDID